METGFMVNAKKNPSSNQSARDPDLTRPSALYCAAAHSRGNGGDPRERNKSNNDDNEFPPLISGNPGTGKTALLSGQSLIS